VVPVNLSTNTAGAPIYLDGGGVVGDDPVSLTITPNGKTVWVGVLTFTGEYLVPVTTATLKKGKAIPISAYPFGCTFPPNGATLYCIDGGYTSGGSVFPIPMSTRVVGSAIPLNGYADSVHASPTGKLLYAASNGDGSLTPVTVPGNSPGTEVFVTPGNTSETFAFTPLGSTAWTLVGGAIQKVTVATGAIGNEIVVPNGGSASQIVFMPDQAPVAAFTDTPAVHGSATSFDASASTAGPHSAPITKYTWKFGDGTTSTTTTPTTMHTYAAAGSYTVTLTLTDQQGTSTKVVFTGQTVSRNGGPQATVSHSVVIG
jgi:hypothetical protein